MECRDAQFYLRLRRHAADELGSDVTAALEGHLAGCPACAADARAAASFDRAMASAMRAVPVPAGLREQLVAHVAAKQGAILRRKFYRGATAAAAAVVLLFLGFGLFSSTRPKVNTYEIAQRNDEQLINPEESTRQWLAEQKLPAQLPPELDFDFSLLRFRGYEKIHGKDVPVIMFDHRNDPRGFAKVYIFRARDGFNTQNIQHAQASLTQAEYIPGQGELDGVHYVVVHTGGPREGLRPFLRVRETGAPIL